MAESLEFYGINTESSIEALLTAARTGGMDEAGALELAVSETRAERGVRH